MFSKLMQVAVLVASGLALGGCPLGGPKTAAPAKKPAAPDYQAPVAASTGTVNRNTCYNAADLTVVRARMLHQELVVATLQCQSAGGSRAFETIYASYNTKFTPDLTANARSLQQLAARKRFNVDVLVTEFANRMAQRAPVDKDFCVRTLRALEWANDPKATSISLVPPPYDLGPEMNIVPCPQ
jgi:hypothetical protein